MYLSHACVSFTYNWYYLHLIRVPPFQLCPPLSASLSLALSLPPVVSPFLFLASALVTWFRCRCYCCWDIPQVATRRGPTWPWPSPDHVMWASSASASASWWSCWQSWGFFQSAFQSSLVALRSSVFGFLGIECWIVRLRTFSCCTVSPFPFPHSPIPRSPLPFSIPK